MTPEHVHPYRRYRAWLGGPNAKREAVVTVRHRIPPQPGCRIWKVRLLSGRVIPLWWCREEAV